MESLTTATLADNPDTTKFNVSNGLTLGTATVTADLYSARNTLTHRIRGPVSTATIVLDTTNMVDGDRAGLSLFRDQSAWIGVMNDGGSLRVGMVDSVTMDASLRTTVRTKMRRVAPCYSRILECHRVSCEKVSPLDNTRHPFVNFLPSGFPFFNILYAQVNRFSILRCQKKIANSAYFFIRAEHRQDGRDRLRVQGRHPSALHRQHQPGCRSHRDL